MIYGIDLGTTYSCVACINQYGKPVVLKNAEGKLTTPSVVNFDEDGIHFSVGNVAKNCLAQYPERTVSLIKREMGKEYTKPTRFPRGLTPVEISSYILKKLVADANDERPDDPPCHDVVITCPAYFGAVAREQTKQAGEIAGLNVRRIVSEPTAAAIAYGAEFGNDDGKDRYVLVYDLGGGTFDITLIRIRGKSFTVLVTGGNRELGGTDWDLCLAEKLLEKFNADCQKHFSFEGNVALKNHFLQVAEENKKLLSAREGVTASIGWGGKSCSIFISRNNFEQWTRPLLDKTITLFMDLLKKAEEKCGFKISPDNTKILLVGGSSRMPQVRSRLDDVLLLDLNCGNVEILLHDPDQCVAKGAALVSDISEEICDSDQGPAPDAGEKNPRTAKVSTFRDVTAKTYGTDVRRANVEQVRNLIYANETLPARAEATFKTVQDNQRMLSIKIFESDSMEKHILPADADLLDGDHQLQLPPGLPAKTECKVCFELDSQGMLHVRAYLVKTGEEIKFDVEVKGILSPDEIEKSKQEVEQSIES